MVVEDKWLVFISGGNMVISLCLDVIINIYHQNMIIISNNKQVPNKCLLIHNNVEFFFILPIWIFRENQQDEKSEKYPTRLHAWLFIYKVWIPP